MARLVHANILLGAFLGTRNTRGGGAHPGPVPGQMFGMIGGETSVKLGHSLRNFQDGQCRAYIWQPDEEKAPQSPRSALRRGFGISVCVPTRLALMIEGLASPRLPK